MLSAPANAKRLRDSIQQLANGAVVERDPTL